MWVSSAAPSSLLSTTPTVRTHPPTHSTPIQRRRHKLLPTHPPTHPPTHLPFNPLIYKEKEEMSSYLSTHPPTHPPPSTVLPLTYSGEDKSWFSRPRSVSWLPMYHDMGLVYGVLTPFYMGARMHYMSPVRPPTHPPTHPPIPIILSTVCLFIHLPVCSSHPPPPTHPPPPYKKTDHLPQRPMLLGASSRQETSHLGGWPGLRLPSHRKKMGRDQMAPERVFTHLHDVHAHGGGTHSPGDDGRFQSGVPPVSPPFAGCFPLLRPGRKRRLRLLVSTKPPTHPPTHLPKRRSPLLHLLTQQKEDNPPTHPPTHPPIGTTRWPTPRRPFTRKETSPGTSVSRPISVWTCALSIPKPAKRWRMGSPASFGSLLLRWPKAIGASRS